MTCTSPAAKRSSAASAAVTQAVDRGLGRYRYMTFSEVIARYVAYSVCDTSLLATASNMSLLLLLTLFSYVHVSNSDLSRIQTYPPRRVHPAPGHERIHPLPAVPLPNYVLMTAASTGEFEPDNDLEVTHEFKLHVNAASEMCMFQKVRQNSRLYFSFKVRSLLT